MQDTDDLEPPSRADADGAGVNGSRITCARTTVSLDVKSHEVPKHLIVEAMMRKRAATLLLLGSLSSLSGFLFAFAIGLLQAIPGLDTHDSYCKRVYDNARLKPCYFPSTVSEMVHDPNRPAGRVFFGFQFVGALLIFFSWYPTSLRNVYIGDDALVPGTPVSWVSFRQYVPAPGLMMLAVITTYPMPQADLLDYFCIHLHMVGALMMFLGYFFVEAVTIGWRCFAKTIEAEKKHIDPRAMKYRQFCIAGLIWSYLIFCLLQLVSFGSGDAFDQWDAWDNCTRLRVNPAICQEPQLIRAADWPVKILKIVSYASEVVCGLFGISSHIVIWYFCEERHFDLPEELSHIRPEGSKCQKETE